MTERTIRTARGAIPSIGVIVPPVLAIMLGAFLVLGIGFARPDTIHNAAHDSRHAFAFPCH